MQLQQQISAERLQEKVGREILVIIDEVDEEGAIGRSMADAPEIDGAVYLNGETNVKMLRQKRFTVGSLTLASSAIAAILEWIALSGEARMTSATLRSDLLKCSS